MAQPKPDKVLFRGPIDVKPVSGNPLAPLTPSDPGCGPPDSGGNAPCCGPRVLPPQVFQDVALRQEDSVSYVGTRLTASDTWGAVRARSGSSRMSYAVAPGLYAVGAPGPESDVLVSANYKLSFDTLRKNLVGRDFWILVLDTVGINVWCAAGKGTFGTDELVNRVEGCELSRRVNHRRLIVPQLGAPGVSGYQVKARTGFSVKWGPVNAVDIPAYVDGGYKASTAMRHKAFPLWERLVLIPIELNQAVKAMLVAQMLFFLLSGFGRGSYLSNLLDTGVFSLLALLVALVAGAILTPLLLPVLPGRAFSVKSLLPSFLLVGGLSYGWHGGNMAPLTTVFESLGWAFMAGALAAFFAMNFTGASTYTSLSGVKKEMRLGVPLQIAGGIVGLGFWVTSRFVA